MDPAAGYAEQASARVVAVMMHSMLPEIHELHLEGPVMLASVTEIRS